MPRFKSQVAGPYKGHGSPPKLDPNWPALFEQYLPRVNSRVLELARGFSRRDRQSVRDMSNWIWSGGWGAPVQPLRPETPTDAIEVALVAIWENRHPELAMFRQVIQ